MHLTARSKTLILSRFARCSSPGRTGARRN